MTTSSELKASLRTRMRALLKGLPREQRDRESSAIAGGVRGLPGWGRGRLLGYVPLGWEVDVMPLLREWLASGGEVHLPFWDPVAAEYRVRQVREWSKDLVAGPHGIGEPAGHCPETDSSTLDFILVPGLAFGVAGERLGRGGGHYDRLLSRSGGVSCGVAYREQMVDGIPMDAHDRWLDWVVHPGGACPGKH
jgi:5-formyltetrahydrofolate cyclo-ligase